jgi:hypothetical protein
MIPYHLTSAVLGIAFAAIILLLVRRDHLRIRYSIWWLLIASVVLFLGLFPGTVDAIGALFGVAYPPTLLLILGIAALLIKILYMDIEHSRLERSLRRLTQRIAMYEAESRDGKARSGDER